MTTRFQRFGFGLGAALIALGVAGAVYASTQNTSAGAPSFMGRRPPFARSGGMGPFAALRGIAGRLGLTDAQKTQLETIAQSHRDEWKALATRAVEARKTLNAAVTADTINDDAIRQASAAVAAVQADTAVARAHAGAEMFQVLTPEQQAQA